MSAKQTDVSTSTKCVEEMIQRFDLPRTLMGGTVAMRAAGVRYLPKEQAESDTAYTNRLNRSTLFNAFGKAVRSTVGKMFNQGIQVEEETDETIKEWLEDVDLQGRDLEAFAHDVVEDAMAVGLSHVLIEFPVTVAAEGQVMSQADEAAAGVRPYWLNIKADQILGWRSERINGQEVLTQLRIMECICEADGEFGERHVDQVRVLTRGGWATWRQNERKEWVPFEEGTTTIDFIPLVTFYTRRTGFLQGRPPLEDLAHVNVAHWQSASDQRNIVHVARVPILFGTGFEDEIPGAPAIEIGASRMIKQPQGATMEYVEHTGNAIESGENDLKQLEEKMAILAMEPVLQNKPGGQTATARALDTAEAQSTLELIASGIEDSIDQCMIFTGAWVKIPKEQCGGVEIELDLALAGQDATGLQELGKARVAGDISRKAYLTEFKRRGLLCPDFDMKADQKELDEEMANEIIPPGSVPGQPVKKPGDKTQPGVNE